MGKKVGRPKAFKEDYIEQARKLALLGMTDEEMAKFFEVSTSTFYNWRNEYPLFLEAIKNAKEISDAEVVHSLYKRALGIEKKTVKQIERDGETVDLVSETYYPPDPTAMIFWLKNRQPKKFRDKQEVEHSGEVSSLAKDFLNKMSEG